MATIGKVRAVFTANANGLSAGVNQASASMRKLSASASATAGSMRSLVAIQGAQLFGSIVTGATNAARALLNYGQSAAESIDVTSKLAARLGFTYEELAGLQLAGDLAGVGIDTIAAAATRADVAFVKAANGSAQAKALFDRLGLSLDQLSGLSAAERFDAIAEAISQLPSEAERSAAAVALFGEAGAQLLPLFQGGAAGIREAREEAERMGLALTTTQGQNVEAMNDAFTRVWNTIKGITNQVVANLAPTVQAIADTFTNFVQSYGGANIGEGIAGAILQAGQYLASVADYVVQNWPAIADYFRNTFAALAAIWEAAKPIVSGLITVGKLLGGVLLKAGSLFYEVLGRLTQTAGQLLRWVPGFGKAGASIDKAGASMRRAATALGENGGALLGSGIEDIQEFLSSDEPRKAGEQLATPFQDAFKNGIAEAQRAAASPDTAPKVQLEVDGKAAGKVIGREVAAGVEQGVSEGVKGLETNSQEGIREMFRILRGDRTRNVQERQLAALEQIADNTEDMGGGLDLDVVDLAPAAGG